MKHHDENCECVACLLDEEAAQYETRGVTRASELDVMDAGEERFPSEDYDEGDVNELFDREDRA